MGCTLAKPIVDGIERDYGDQLKVLRVDIQTETGQEIAYQLKSMATPTFIFFDGSGKELWRTIGRIDPQRIRDQLQ
jgi:thioredoxin-related protein